MTKPKSATKPTEPVNSEQLEMQETPAPPISEPEDTQVAPAPTPGELEERAIDAENRAQAAESKLLTLAEEMEILKKQMALLVKRSKAPPAGASASPLDKVDANAVPVFDEEMPYGLVTGDIAVAYVQDGHQFGRDKQYIATELHRGSPRAFNPRMVGWVKPKPNQTAFDPLDGIRGRE